MSDLKTYLLKRIDTTMCGTRCRMRLGDLDGDGRMEIVMVQSDSGFDERYFPHSVVCATAFNLEGELLWQIGAPDPEAKEARTDIPAQIYDIDNDGNNEFLCVMNGEFCIYDGKSGSLKRKYPLPDKYAHDCIIIADLEGRGYPQNIILKNRYHQLWALDVNFNVMWTFKGNIGHYPWPYDLDGDGRDELIAGSAVLSGDGNVLWTVPMENHADSIWIGDLDQNPETGPSVLIGGVDTSAYSRDGKPLWSFTDTAELQNITAGNFCPENKGTEISALYRTDSSSQQGTDKLFLFDYQGKLLCSETRAACSGSTCTAAIHNFDGSGRDHLLVYGRGGLPAAIYDGQMNPVFTFPFDGHIMWADLIGDGISDILIYDDEKIEIYAAQEADLAHAAVPYTRPQPKRLYNQTDCQSSEMDPSQYAVSYITGDFTTNEPADWAQKCSAGKTEDADAVISRADFIVLLVNTLKLRAYERENFSDVYPRDYFAKAAGVAKKLGIAEGTLGRFNPHAPITAEAAVEMINRAGCECFCMSEGELTKRSAAKIVIELLRTME